MIRSTTSFLSAASTFPPSTTEPHGPGLSSFGPRSRVPRLPRRAGSIPPFAIFGRQVDGAAECFGALRHLLAHQLEPEAGKAALGREQLGRRGVVSAGRTRGRCRGLLHYLAGRIHHLP